MLTAIGPGLASLQDITRLIDARSHKIGSQQGDTLDSMRFTLDDRTNKTRIVDEDDIISLDDADTNGWPTVNLCLNPRFSGAFVADTYGVVAPNWFRYTTRTVGTLTLASSATTTLGTAASQSIVISNIDNGAEAGVFQTNYLPTDNDGAPIVTLPYAFTAYVEITAALVGAYLQPRIDWKTASGSYISSAFGANWTPTGTTGWVRLSAMGTPPSNAVIASIGVSIHATSATNSGTWLMTAAQFEYEVFGNSIPYDGFPVINPSLLGIIGAGNIATQWTANNVTTGVSLAIIKDPGGVGTAQQVACLNVAQTSNTMGILQSKIPINPSNTYTLTMQYRIIAPMLGGAKIRFGINAYDVTNTYISTPNATNVTDTSLNQPMSITLAFGANTAHPLPAGTTYIQIFAGMVSDLNGGQGTVALSNIALWPSKSAAKDNAAYPTPYCDANQPGCYTDTSVTPNLYYRQLRLFGGYVRVGKRSYTTSPERKISISAVEYGILLQEAPVTLNVAVQLDSAAIAAGATYAKNLGFLAGVDTSTFVQSIGTVDAHSFQQATFRELLNYVANQTVAAYYLDYYKRLHYAPTLTQTGAFNLSDAPDNVTTFAYQSLEVSDDSTQSVTEPVIEGGPATSFPQNYSASGTNATLSSGLTNGTVYTALPVNAIAIAIPAASKLTINVGGGTTQVVTTSAAVAAGAISIPVNSFTANSSYASATPIAIATTFTVNAGSGIELVDSVTAAGVAQVVGVAGTNDAFGVGSPAITALYTKQSGVVQLQTAIGAAQTFACTFRFSQTVLVRLHGAGAAASTGAIRRHIFAHIKLDAIRSKQSAIDRAHAEVGVNSRPRTVITATVWSPPTPAANPPRPGTVIQLTHAIEGFNATQFQVIAVTTSPLGNGIIQRELQLGFYRPDLVALMAQSLRHTGTSDVGGNTILQDVLEVGDGWALGDVLQPPTVSNVGTWGGPSTWNGTLVWG